ncbi:MAG: LysM peptidoglycan-binding domain-containing protein [Hyphomicrobiales bacterium]
MIFLAIAGTGATAVGGFVAYERYQESQKTELAKLAEPEVKAPKTAEKVEPEKKVVEEKPALPSAPTFDIVRVEKDGSMLVAGQAEPLSEITLMNGDKPIGTAKADETGAFVVLPDNPLTGANNEISIRSKRADGSAIDSEQRVAVAVPEQGEALVALVEPGKPVEILQKPEPKAEPKPIEVAKAPEPAPEPAPVAEVEPAPEPEPEPVPAPEVEIATAAPTPEAEPAPVAEPEPVTVLEKTQPAVEPEKTAVAKVEELGEEVQPEPALEVVPKPIEKAREESKKRVARLLKEQQVPAPVVEQAIVATPEPAEPTAPIEPTAPVEPPTPVETSVVEAPTPEPEPEPQVEQVAAVVEEQKPEAAPEPAKIVETAKVVEPAKTITVDAVEVENDTLFVAGKASPNETVRVYVDGKLVGDAKSSEGGNWLLEQTKPLGPGRYNIRVDLLNQGTADVAARAAVPFAVEDLTPAELAGAKVGNVIIRKNDNLWTIAQRLYGDGRRYTSIYQQNKGQIKNPELIFPGQIFKVPGEGQVPGAASTVNQAVVVAPSVKPQAQ